ncbi:hypothetical protein BG015_002623 [Linnemannia schmuckeri]|uniref:NADP-dependent oxidoreductase domain-containing protein n=1 Tax=Linnemannia schmuckeri TaxID=64567 RepID=A0A9P5RNS2_9FUNG|nr:hypothetical protein BG015_002623 [Linnemannia schmuckeri]
MTNTTTTTTANIPRVILGTMTFGLESTDAETSAVRVRGAQAVGPFLTTFSTYGHTEIDTARFYSNGDTETVLSQLPTAHMKISTKVYPFAPGSHNKENLPRQFRASLKALKVEKVDILYLHVPDYDTPYEETCKAMDDLYREGLFEKFGLSNYSSWNVVQIYEICKQNGYVLPTVYQGMYNPIARSVTTELLPCLRHYNISFYAYNPICGGVLSGKYNFNVDPEGTRYDPKTLIGQIVCDGILIGSTSVAQLEESLTELEKGPLPEEMVKAFDEAWEAVKGTTNWYFRGPDAPKVAFLQKKE